MYVSKRQPDAIQTFIFIQTICVIGIVRNRHVLFIYYLTFLLRDRRHGFEHGLWHWRWRRVEWLWCLSCRDNFGVLRADRNYSPTSLSTHLVSIIWMWRCISRLLLLLKLVTITVVITWCVRTRLHLWCRVLDFDGCCFEFRGHRVVVLVLYHGIILVLMHIIHETFIWKLFCINSIKLALSFLFCDVAFFAV